MLSDSLLINWGHVPFLFSELESSCNKTHLYIFQNLGKYNKHHLYGWVPQDTTS